MSPWLWLNHAKSILRVFAQTASADFFGPRSRKPRQLMKWLFPHSHTHTHQIQSIIEWAFQLILDRITANNLLANSQKKYLIGRPKVWAHDDQPVRICHDESERYDAFECIWIYLNHFDSSHASKVQLLSKESSTAQRITRCLLALERNPGQRRVPQLHWHMFCCDWYKGLFTRSYCQGLFWSFTMPNCGRIGCDTVQ